MTTSEPTTGEIVRALRCSADDDSFCKKCQYGYALGSAFLCDRGRMNQNASDRLESQERTIAEKDAEIEKLKSDRCMILGAVTETNVCVGNLIERLTARAESAERERDSAVAYMKRFGCLTCEGQGTIGANEPCWGCRDKSNWKMRGLQPQDGVKE